LAANHLKARKNERIGSLRRDLFDDLLLLEPLHEREPSDELLDWFDDEFELELLDELELELLDELELELLEELELELLEELELELLDEFELELLDEFPTSTTEPSPALVEN
jgi:hypothetical protein